MGDDHLVGAGSCWLPFAVELRAPNKLKEVTGLCRQEGVSSWPELQGAPHALPALLLQFRGVIQELQRRGETHLQKAGIPFKT